jgi:hypothetical protein
MLCRAGRNKAYVLPRRTSDCGEDDDNPADPVFYRIRVRGPESKQKSRVFSWIQRIFFWFRTPPVLLDPVNREKTLDPENFYWIQSFFVQPNGTLIFFLPTDRSKNAPNGISLFDRSVPLDFHLPKTGILFGRWRATYRPTKFCTDIRTYKTKFSKGNKTSRLILIAPTYQA